MNGIVIVSVNVLAYYMDGIVIVIVSELYGWDAWESASQPQTVMSGLDMVKIELTNCLSINNGVAIQLVFLDALPFLESKLAECVSLQASASSRFFILVFLLHL